MLLRLDNNPFTTNSYILWNETDALLVDPVGSINHFEQVLKERGLVCRGILYTHGHYDHIASANVASEFFQVPIYIHELDKDMLYQSDKSLATYFSRTFSLEEHRKVVAFQDGDLLTFGALSVEVIHTPGHTPGSVCFKHQDELITGDTLFAGSIGRTDFPGSDGKAMQTSLTRIKAMEGDPGVHPGHGPSSTLEEERQTNPYLKRMR